jgi:hypothetical protein
MRKLIEANLTVIMYTGDADYNCNWLGGQAVAEEISAPGYSDAGEIKSSPYIILQLLIFLFSG